MVRFMLLAAGVFAALAFALFTQGIQPADVGPTEEAATAPIVTARVDELEPLRRELEVPVAGPAVEERSAPEPVQVAPPVLSLPEPRSMPFTDVLEPETFEDLWTIIDPQHGYTADGPRYFLAHTHTQGGAIGNAVNEADLTPGAAIDIAGVRFHVTSASTIAKPDIGTLPIWQATDPDDAYLVVCLWNNGVRATHNLVIEMHRS